MTSWRNSDSVSIRLRIGDSLDVNAITVLINAAFQVERFFLDKDRITTGEVRDRLKLGQFILAEDDSGFAGCVYVEPRGGRAYLGLLSVHPSRQRSGLGKLLMAAGEDHARNTGCRFLDLQLVNVREELPAFYRALGYVENGTAPFPEDAQPKIPCHFVKMTKPLTKARSPVQQFLLE
jgi:GNAT superfamily N-acetyltransferase